jgi:cyclase
VGRAVRLPLNASGGAGTMEHLAEVLLRSEADAVLAASIFHFGQHTVADVKRYLRAQGICVRLE